MERFISEISVHKLSLCLMDVLSVSSAEYSSRLEVEVLAECLKLMDIDVEEYLKLGMRAAGARQSRFYDLYTIMVERLCEGIRGSYGNSDWWRRVNESATLRAAKRADAAQTVQPADVLINFAPAGGWQELLDGLPAANAAAAPSSPSGAAMSDVSPAIAAVSARVSDAALAKAYGEEALNAAALSAASPRGLGLGLGGGGAAKPLGFAAGRGGKGGKRGGGAGASYRAYAMPPPAFAAPIIAGAAAAALATTTSSVPSLSSVSTLPLYRPSPPPLPPQLPPQPPAEAAMVNAAAVAYEQPPAAGDDAFFGGGGGAEETPETWGNMGGGDGDDAMASGMDGAGGEDVFGGDAFGGEDMFGGGMDGDG